jgi:hypothetical protein
VRQRAVSTRRMITALPLAERSRAVRIGNIERNPRQPLFAPPIYRRSHERPSRERRTTAAGYLRILQIAQSPLHNTSYHSLSAPSRRTAKTRLGHDESRTITPTTYRPLATERPFTETRVAPQLDPGTNVVRIATLRMPAILVHRRPA